MDLNTVINVVTNIKKGTFTRIKYMTDVPVKAKYKKQGLVIKKIGCMTTRFGIHYPNIKSVGNKIDNSYVPNDNLHWVVKDTIQYNKKTDNHYLCTYPTEKGRNSEFKYIIKTPNMVMYSNTLRDVSEYVLPSYFNKKGDAVTMMKININNVLQIG